MVHLSMIKNEQFMLPTEVLYGLKMPYFVFSFIRLLGDSMKRGRIENFEKLRNYLNILKCLVPKLCVACNEFPKVGNTKLKKFS